MGLPSSKQQKNFVLRDDEKTMSDTLLVAVNALYRRNGKHNLVFRQADWNKIKRTIKKHGSKRLQAKLKALDIEVTPLELDPKEN